MNVYIHKPVNYSDMQGPCAEGFHIPTSAEFQNLGDTFNAIGISGTFGTIFKTYLKLPATGCRAWSDTNIYDTTQGLYWTCEVADTDGWSTAIILQDTDASLNITKKLLANAFAIRPFKDEVVIPDSSWTALYSDKIYHNATLGLISLSSDGINWITIADKNLGATTVWNSGDTVSDTNGGLYYQRGNNYGYSREGTVTKSTTQINGSSYGPGNYYSSSTYIYNNYDWSSIKNDNRRGGVTGAGGENELKKAYIGEYVPDFATRGPAPEGFHVPLYTEWQGLYTIMSGLGLTTTGNSWRINLHMPFVGCRSWSSAEIGNQGSNGCYWSSSPVGSSTNHNDARYLLISSSRASADYGDPRTQAYSVRCFKNSYVTPDSSWTVVQGTLGSAGIFRNQTKGLISITSDGTTGYTIQDKNLGATAVYNDGDTLSEANCGKYYQWGNNYGFPFTGSVTTSSTQVDTTGYGPGNYYSSNTFITRSGDYRDWSSVQNNNRRGGVDGNVPV